MYKQASTYQIDIDMMIRLMVEISQRKSKTISSDLIKISFNLKQRQTFKGKKILGTIMACVTTFAIYLSFNIMSISHSN